MDTETKAGSMMIRKKKKRPTASDFKEQMSALQTRNLCKTTRDEQRALAALRKCQGDVDKAAEIMMTSNPVRADERIFYEKDPLPGETHEIARVAGLSVEQVKQIVEPRAIAERLMMADQDKNKEHKDKHGGESMSSDDKKAEIARRCSMSVEQLEQMFHPNASSSSSSLSSLSDDQKQREAAIDAMEAKVKMVQRVVRRAERNRQPRQRVVAYKFDLDRDMISYGFAVHRKRMPTGTDNKAKKKAESKSRRGRPSMAGTFLMAAEKGDPVIWSKHGKDMQMQLRLFEDASKLDRGNQLREKSMMEALAKLTDMARNPECSELLDQSGVINEMLKPTVGNKRLEESVLKLARMLRRGRPDPFCKKKHRETAQTDLRTRPWVIARSPGELRRVYQEAFDSAMEEKKKDAPGPKIHKRSSASSAKSTADADEDARKRFAERSAKEALNSCILGWIHSNMFQPPSKRVRMTSASTMPGRSRV